MASEHIRGTEANFHTFLTLSRKESNSQHHIFLEEHFTDILVRPRTELNMVVKGKTIAAAKTEP
jgi:hypothetical protein